MKKSKLKQFIKKIIVEIISEKDKNARTEHFTVQFTKDNAAKVLLGNVYIGNALLYPDDPWSFEYANKWMFNREASAFKLNLPQMTKPYATLQEMLDDLEQWYSTTIAKK